MAEAMSVGYSENKTKMSTAAVRGEERTVEVEEEGGGETSHLATQTFEITQTHTHRDAATD